MANRVLPEVRYPQKARELARGDIARMDEDGFLECEGGRIRGIKYGVDPGYNIDMSLWGLALYARQSGDTAVEQAVSDSLKTHLAFVYPNGSIDGSWGIRSNKWTTYGSATADGCQILFSLFTGEDPRYRTAALRNLRYLRKMMRDGIVGYGPHYWRLFDTPPCIYPTFARAKNLALAIEFGDQSVGPTSPLPTDRAGYVRHFPTVDVAQVRTGNFMATVTAYRYKDVRKSVNSKYMYRPTGGSLCNLWVAGHGFLQTSSQTKYTRSEPMHFPEAPGIQCLTPRIEFTNEAGYFTNLYEYDGRLAWEQDNRTTSFFTTGELKDENWWEGGVGYHWTHRFSDDRLEKSVLLKFHGKPESVRIVEPIVEQLGMTFRQTDANTILMEGGKRTFQFRLLDGSATLELGTDADKYWSPFPSLKCFPIEIVVASPTDGSSQSVRYEISLMKN
jgi:hypothetical protein